MSTERVPSAGVHLGPTVIERLGTLYANAANRSRDRLAREVGTHATHMEYRRAEALRIRLREQGQGKQRQGR